MRLICVNDGKIIFRDKGLTCHGNNLVEGEVYTTNCKPFKDENGTLNYYIDGLGAKLTCRFAELEDDREMMISKKEEVKKVLLEPCLN